MHFPQIYDYKRALCEDREISRLDVKLRTPTSIEGVPEMPTPWVSRTLNSPTEAISQSESIKNQIA